MNLPQQELDPAAILAALDVMGAQVVERVTGGADTAIWKVRREGRDYALRVFRPEQANVCRREVAVMCAAEAQGIPVPKVSAEGAWQDRPALLVSWCPGRTLGAELLAHPWKVWTLGKVYGAMLARLHTVPAPECLRHSAPDWIADAGEQETALQERLRRVADLKSALLHLDFHPMNLMTDGSQITSILDWANTRAGDPRADVARTVALMQTAALEMKSHLPVRALIALLEKRFLQGYEEIAGRQSEMPLFYAWAWAMTAKDYADKRGRPGFDWKPAHYDALRRQLAFWKTRSGLFD